MTGAEALPRANGELVFEAPWQARAFGVAVGLVREQEARLGGVPQPPDRRDRAWEREHRDSPSDGYKYYERWLAALERLVLETGMVTAQELESEILRATAADRHHGHDH